MRDMATKSRDMRNRDVKDRDMRDRWLCGTKGQGHDWQRQKGL